jgi:hypothetical protein
MGLNYLYCGMQKRIADNIFCGLEKLKTGEESNEELSLVFQAAFNIVSVYLKKNKSKFGFLNNREDYNLNDAVMEIITPLFLNRNERKYYKLITAYEKWEPPVKSNGDALFFLHQLIFIRTEHYLSKALEKVDPLYSIILKDVNLKIIQSGYYKIRYLGQSFVSESESIDAGKNIINDDWFDQLHPDIFVKDNFLSELFDYLKYESHFAPAIPLNTLVLKLKRLNLPFYTEIRSEMVIEESFYTEEVVLKSLDVSLSKLVRSYVSKNKLTDIEADLFTKALKEISYDLRDGGINIGLYEYFKKYNPVLSRQEYKLKYDNILEYLVKLMKQTAMEILIKDF